ncbi:multicopper oxidase domain-containing protein [Nocardioides sp.]|uniref:multicopper oxidase domain-containing protein n=1 Tax=Nocardioides sp. TaxID=35761 RepID=UPI002ED699E2
MSVRGFWPMRDLPTVCWLVATVVATLVHPFVPAPRWLMIHLLLLGAVGHAILVWSRYFADTLLRVPPTPRRQQSTRLVLFNAGVALVIGGVLVAWWPVVAAGAALLGGAVLWHGAVLLGQLRGSLASRFAPTVRYYVAAAALLPVGAGLGVWLATGLADPLHDRVRTAHMAINVLGWIGLTVLGTLVTLWPTVLRTRIAEGAERASARALPLLVAGVLLTATAALGGPRLVAVGVVTYLAGASLLLVPAIRVARTRPPTSFPAWSILAGYCWFVGSLGIIVVGAVTATSWSDLGAAFGTVTPLLAVGFAAQVLLGALSYLVPVVLGGGPSPVRAANRVVDTGGALRLVLTNLGLAVCALPVPSTVRVLVSFLVVGALASFVPILLVAIRTWRRVRDGVREPSPPGRGRPSPDGDRPPGQRAGLAVTGLAMVLVASASGAALDPAALAGPVRSAAAGVEATGEITRVEVTAEGMRFSPDSVTVPAGNRLVITLHNAADGDVHDLVLENGAGTGRVGPGETVSVDLGVVGRALDGWCSVLGHRQMGMVFLVEVTGDAPTQAPPAEPTPTAPDGHHSGHVATSGTSSYEPGATPGPDFSARDARLPALPPGRVHRVMLTVTETEREVAPGVRQTVWSYGGEGAPGPVLHGRVGDRFVVTLINDGSIGHSVDFHAGSLAPDRPMRTIEPGESLVYRFTATRAGIWMYHCSTMPMSAHIAAGLFGAVVIEPRGLPPVDRSYVLVQSELYLGEDGGAPDLAKLASDSPDAVVFNGYPDQYAHEPLRARVGERVRLWVLDAGPARPLSFHVVGGQFDRVWSEGSWQLGSAKAPARHTGAQVLSLLPAEGGFVELTFPEPGHYPFVNHVMTDGERGARGVLEVGQGR